MTDQTIPEEAIEAAAREEWSIACSEYDYDWDRNAEQFRDQARRILAAAYPHLRQQIETEVRRQVEAEIEQMESAWYFGGLHAPGVRVVSLEGTLLAARGAAQPGGTE